MDTMPVAMTMPNQAGESPTRPCRGAGCTKLRPPSEALARPQVAPLPERQGAERDPADAHTLQAGHLEADQLAHAPDLALAPFAQHEAQLVLVLPGHLGRPQLDAVEPQAVAQALQTLGGDAALHADQLLLLDRALAADQQPRDAPVLGEHEQAGRIDVEAARGGETSPLAHGEADGRPVVPTAVVGVGQVDRRTVARLGLAGDVADRLVRQDRDSRGR